MSRASALADRERARIAEAAYRERGGVVMVQEERRSPWRLLLVVGGVAAGAWGLSYLISPTRVRRPEREPESPREGEANPGQGPDRGASRGASAVASMTEGTGGDPIADLARRVEQIEARIGGTTPEGGASAGQGGEYRRPVSRLPEGRS